MLYYVNRNKQANGDHEVHTANCIYLPSEPRRMYLGDFTSCKGAVEESKNYYPQSNGCKTCSNECHTG
jgi:hypothetical protein